MVSTALVPILGPEGGEHLAPGAAVLEVGPLALDRRGPLGRLRTRRKSSSGSRNSTTDDPCGTPDRHGLPTDECWQLAFRRGATETMVQASESFMESWWTLRRRSLSTSFSPGASLPGRRGHRLVPKIEHGACHEETPDRDLAPFRSRSRVRSRVRAGGRPGSPCHFSDTADNLLGVTPAHDRAV